jgi:toxin ParE1/3/4
MSFDEVKPPRLTPQALTDLEGIWRYSAETWSVAQADHYTDELARVFDTIAALPTLARERLEFNPPVRIHTHERHLIVYVLADDHVAVLRVLGSRQDWVSILTAADS